MNITRQRAKYTSRVVKFASQVLFSMWQHQELREVYRKSGWKESDFVTKTVAARNARPNSPTNLNSTLNRPMASQGGTRYEDRTMRHQQQPHHANNSAAPTYHVSLHISLDVAVLDFEFLYCSFQPEDVPMENLTLYSGGGAQGAGRPYHPGQQMVGYVMSMKEPKLCVSKSRFSTQQRLRLPLGK